MLSAYCIGNAAGPFMWQSQYKPRYILSFPFPFTPQPALQWCESCSCRNRIPWIIIGVCYVTCPLLLLVIRWLLARENSRRDAEPSEEEEEFFIEQVSEDGKRVQVKVDKVWCRPSCCCLRLAGMGGRTLTGF